MFQSVLTAGRGVLAEIPCIFPVIREFGVLETRSLQPPSTATHSRVFRLSPETWRTLAKKPGLRWRSCLGSPGTLTQNMKADVLRSCPII